MAEGFARQMWGDRFDVRSAGTQPGVINPLAVKVMSEVGIDISGQYPKGIEDAVDGVDVVVSVCADAEGACPVVPGVKRRLHRAFDDPPRLAARATSEAEALPHYRRVRDEIRLFIQTLPAVVYASGVCSHEKGGQMNLKNDAVAEKKVCCPGSGCCDAPSETGADAEKVREIVRDGYSKIAVGGGWTAGELGKAASACCTPSKAGGGCCGPATFSPEQLAKAIGYSTDELETVPDSANMGLSCGNPTALASLRAGEVVLDLGSGGGFDCFIAGPKVGSTGRVIGVDMTPEMVSKARGNIAWYRQTTGLTNVEFRLGEIEHLPVADASVDVVISNCVLNLAPDQSLVWKDLARVLKPGGRVAISDLVLLRPLPASVRVDVEALVGCVAGAALITDIQAWATAAGLSDVRIDRKPGYVDAMTDWQDPLYRAIIAKLGPGEKIGDYVSSADISAVKR